MWHKCIILTAFLCKSYSAPVSQKEEARGLLEMIGLHIGTSCRPPVDFPSAIPIKRQVFKDPLRNYADKWLWKCTPRNQAQMIILSNWAFANGYQLQPVDLLTAASLSSSVFGTKLTRDTNCTRTLLVDGTKSLVKVKMVGKNLVSVETGVRIMKLLEYLEEQGLGLPIAPIPGQKILTVGEAISIGAYGIGVNSVQESAIPFGSVSSLIMSFKTLVWDRVHEVYTLKQLIRSDPRAFAFLTNLGRSYITEVTLLVQPIYKLRCQTFSEFSSENLFASPNSTFSLVEESFAYLVGKYGRVEVTHFPYADRSWVKVWSRENQRPLGSLKVNKAYLSGASSPIANAASVMATKIMSIFPSFAPSLSRMLFDIGVFRMRLSGANDIFGASHDTFFTFTNDTETYNSRGYAVLSSRDEIQQVVHQFYQQFSLLREQFQQQGKYPTARPIKIRIASLDFPLSVSGSSSLKLSPPALSVLSPIKSHPEFDIAVIFELEFLPNDSSGEDFISELEPWIYANYQGDYALIRPLWSTEWTHEAGASYKGHAGHDFKQLIKKTYGASWHKAIRVLEFYDPHGVFNNPFFESLAKA